LTNAIAAVHGTAEFEAELRQALEVFWRGDSSAAANMSNDNSGAANAIIKQSQRLMDKLGHYSTAMLHYAGEWFWGVDRLHYLLARLDELGASNVAAPDPRLMSIKQAMAVSLPVRPPTAAKELPPIEYFHSFRSPYSYIALEQTFAIADAFGIEVKIRPVLPMVMRGMKLPRQKLFYIAHDTFREARRRNLPFGKIADPVGTGAERCLAVSRFAESEHREREFMINAGRAIWAEGVDVATDVGMRKVTGRSGLFWPEAKAAMQNDDWRESIDENRESMMDSGTWGVPTIRMGDFVLWGQDRDWMLIRHIEEHCDTGDGILV